MTVYWQLDLFFLSQFGEVLLKGRFWYPQTPTYRSLTHSFLFSLYHSDISVSVTRTTSSETFVQLWILPSVCTVAVGVKFLWICSPSQSVLFLVRAQTSLPPIRLNGWTDIKANHSGQHQYLSFSIPKPAYYFVGLQYGTILSFTSLAGFSTHFPPSILSATDH